MSMSISISIYNIIYICTRTYLTLRRLVHTWWIYPEISTGSMFFLTTKCW